MDKLQTGKAVEKTEDMDGIMGGSKENVNDQRCQGKK